MARLLLLALLVAGCAPLQWMRADATQEQTRADVEDCQQRAWREAQWRSGPPVRAGRWRDPFWADRSFDEARLARFCMEVRGYTLREVPR